MLHLVVSATAQVSLNTVDNVEAFSADIAAGRWDTVLPQVALCGAATVMPISKCMLRAQVAQLQLPRRKLEELYEHIFLVRRVLGCTPLALTGALAGAVRAVRARHRTHTAASKRSAQRAQAVRARPILAAGAPAR